jgi:hypothetical protein
MSQEEFEGVCSFGRSLWRRWFAALYLLFCSFPVWIDGSGAMPSLYWATRPPTPSYGEWLTNWRTRLHVYYSYLTEAALSGCGLTPWLIRRWRPAPSRVFWVASATTFISLVTLKIASDAWAALQMWRGATVYGREVIGFVYRDMIRADVVLVFKLIGPMSLLAGLIAVANRRRPHVQPESVFA